MNQAILGVMREMPGCAEYDLNDGLVLDVVRDSHTCVGEMPRLLQRVAAAARTGDEAEASVHFLELISGLDMVTRSVELLGAALGPDFQSLEYRGCAICTHLGELNGVLMEILGAQEKNDWILLGDLLEYELKDHILMWEEIFAMIGAELLRDEYGNS